MNDKYLRQIFKTWVQILENILFFLIISQEYIETISGRCEI